MSGSLRIHGLLFKYKSLDRSYKLHTPAATERGELNIIKKINEYILEIGSPITIKIGNYVFENVYGANKIAGTPKADIALVSYNTRTKKFKEVCFISHKMGKDAGGFQQYSGVSPKADATKRGSISKNSNVVNFLEKVEGFQPVISQAKKRVYSVIKDKDLVGKSIYGPHFGEKKFGINNVHLIAQGDIVLKRQGSDHILNFSVHVSYNSDVTDFMRRDYTAIIGARYDSRSSKKIRVLIMPKKLIGSKAEEI